MSLAERKQAEKRRAIAEAALKVFSRDGFSAAKMDDVALEAGVAKGTLYLYHASKEELFEATVREKLLPLLDAVGEISLAHEGPAEDLLRAQVNFFYTHIVGTDVAQIMRMIIAEGPRFPRLAEFYHREVISRGEQIVMKTIDYGVSRGEFVPLEGEQIGKVLMGPAIMIAIWRMVFDRLKPVDLDAFFDTHMAFLLRAIRA
jgi:AcrR family transcriptional regulator